MTILLLPAFFAASTERIRHFDVSADIMPTSSVFRPKPATVRRIKTPRQEVWISYWINKVIEQNQNTQYGQDLNAAFDGNRLKATGKSVGKQTRRLFGLNVSWLRQAVNNMPSHSTFRLNGITIRCRNC
ncbi:MAG TPA: hypothetical protein VFE62_00660 [Gemmataceae bacterium]|nr:hypothetical protein [Gemmataceae bacterium]